MPAIVLEGVRVPEASASQRPVEHPGGFVQTQVIGSVDPLTAQTLAIAVAIDLVAIDNEQHILDAAHILLDQRAQAGSRVALTGTDDTGCLRLAIHMDLDSPLIQASLSYQLHSVPATELFPLLRFLRALRRPRRLGLMVDGMLIGKPEPLVAESAEIPAEYVDLLRALAFVQDVTGVEFAVPEGLTAEDSEAILEAEELLSGGEIEGPWSEARLEGIDPAILDAMGDGATYRFELYEVVSVTIAQHTFPLGEATHRFMSARLDNSEEISDAARLGQEIEARMVPIGQSRYVRRLNAAPRRPPGDPFARIAILPEDAFRTARPTSLGRGA